MRFPSPNSGPVQRTTSNFLIIKKKCFQFNAKYVEKEAEM